ncbi:serine hydrolase [Wenzhouxiangella sp. XN79A]|uniref:serine hydrolase n=1 Tax=Wenzhouxiangella sp. XN79A TaxID=2724193 RepID=UPI00144AB5E3|nr:serine hydrolase [Wenzhouxiangella sp. XN79A]NKI36366.1 serine hydrolase [Wenzhouxiangella sp. XN79A]
MTLTRPTLAAAVALVLGSAGMNAPAQTGSLADDPRVSDAVQLWTKWMEYQASIARAPAVSWGFVHDQELIASGAFGQANPATDRPATPETLYSICSISKLFTSVAAMQLREDGALRLDDPVAEHLDWFEAIEDVHPDDEAITVGRLLTHSAGLPRESDFPYWTDPDYPFPTSEQIRRRLGSQQTLYPASRYFQYSNLGLTLVGEVVAEVAGAPYDDYMRSALLDPLGMADTTTDIPVDLHGGALAVGHTALNRDGTRDAVIPFRTRGIAPAAGFASNVPDLAKFAMWQFRVLDGADSELLKASSLREMQRVHWVDPDWATTWGLGFSVRQEGNRSFARHGGGCPGYFTEFRIEPKTKIGAIVLTSAIGSEPGLYAGQAFELIAPAIEKAQEASGDAPERNPDFARYEGVYKSIWGQTAVVRWDEGLAVLGLSSRTPAESLERFEHVEGASFRRIRADGDTSGETLRFELGPDGEVMRFQRHSIHMERIEP